MNKNIEYNNNLSTLRNELVKQNAELYELRQVLVAQNDELERNKTFLIQQNKELQKSKKRLEKTEKKYIQLFSSMKEGIMICEFVFDKENNPVDYIIKEINPAFEKITGINRNEALSNPASLLFGEDTINPLLLDKYYRVATGQEPIYFEDYNKIFNKYLGISVFSDKKKQFNVMLVDITERIKAQEELNTAQNIFNTLADIAFDIIVMIDQDARVCYWNKAAEKKIGYTKDEAIDSSIVELVIPNKYKKKFMKKLNLLMKKEIGNYYGNTLELEVKRKDGTTFIAECSSTTINIDEKYYSIGILRDITEKKALYERIRNAQIKQKAILDSVPDYIWLKDIDGKFQEMNRAFLNFLNLKREDVIGKTVFDLFPEHIAKEFHDDDQYIYNNPKMKIIEEEINFKDKEPIFNETIKIPILDNGKILGISGIARDITKRKKEAKALLLTQYSIDNASIGTLWVNREGNLTAVNKKMEEILGYSKAELLKMYVYNIDFQHSSETWNKRWIELKKIKKDTFQKTFTRKDGKNIPVEININFVDYDNDEYLFAYIKDISEKIEYENKLNQKEIEFKTVLNSTLDAINIIDENGLIIFWNKASEKMFGYSEQEVIGKSLKNIYLPEDKHQLFDQIIENFKDSRTFDYHNKIFFIELLKKDYTKLTAETTVSPVELSNIPYLISIIREKQ